MPWLHTEASTVTEWAVEYTYAGGEKHYFTDDYDKAEANEAAQVANLERLRKEDPGPSACVVSRQITYTAWS